MKLAKSTKIIVLIVGILFFLQLFVSSKLTAMGSSIAEIEKTVSEFKHDNRILEEKIASASALTKIKTEAEKIGLNNEAEVLFIDDSYYMVAK